MNSWGVGAWAPVGSRAQYSRQLLLAITVAWVVSVVFLVRVGSLTKAGLVSSGVVNAATFRGLRLPRPSTRIALT